MRHFTREELQDIREKALKLAADQVTGGWTRAYRALADAADRLDAMEARTIEKD